MTVLPWLEISSDHSPRLLAVISGELVFILQELIRRGHLASQRGVAVDLVGSILTVALAVASFIAGTSLLSITFLVQWPAECVLVVRPLLLYQ